jgi:hypothetical protein
MVQGISKSAHFYVRVKHKQLKNGDALLRRQTFPRKRKTQPRVFYDDLKKT